MSNDKITSRYETSILNEVWQECGQLLEERDLQYSSGGQFDSFESAAQIANVSVDTVFRVIIGIKLSRVACGGNVHDSLVDTANYCILWAAYKKTR